MIRPKTAYAIGKTMIAATPNPMNITPASQL